MKKFNLDAALNGEPVMLRNGDKAFIFKNIQNTPILDFKSDYPLIGMIHNHAAVQTWSLDGRASLTNDCADRDIVGMFEEPKISTEDLPKPFHPNYKETYFYICGFNVYKVKQFFPHARFDSNNAKHGQCFRTAEDAQKWIDFMKSMVE